MTDLQTLLNRSVDHHVDLDPAADLRRGRSALRRRRRTVVIGIAAAVLALGATATALARSSVLPIEPAHSVRATVHAGQFQVPHAPAGWSIWQATSSYVLYAPSGTPPPDPEVGVQVAGKLIIQLEEGTFAGLGRGTPVEYGGRTFFDLESGNQASQVVVRQPSGRWLVLQEAPSLHWTQQQMVEFLAAVVVSPDATAVG